jgi:hypothetical protein
VKINRPNMADLSRTFAGSGESDSKAPPEVSIDMLPSITPIMEFCRPMALRVAGNSDAIQDESFAEGFASNIAAGSSSSAPRRTFRRGVWRISMSATFVCTGAVPVATNYFILALVGPDVLLAYGLHLLTGAAMNVPVVGNLDFLVHFPTDDWDLTLEISDPVTALAVNRARGSYYACHLL